MAGNNRNLTLENVSIVFRNFEGKEGKYNRAGDRNFAILLNEDLASQLVEEGWAIKYLKARDEGDQPQAYLPIALSFKGRPPKVCLITSRGLTYLEEQDVATLDWVDIETADVTLNPYNWAVNDKSGIKAYVVSLFIKIVEDYLQEKWTRWAESNATGALAVGAGADYIDGEVVHEPLQIER